MLILSLFITNLWILLYNELLTLLNSLFPAKTVTDFIRVGASPEPFEISLYLFLTLVFIFTLYLFYKYMHKENVENGLKPLPTHIIKSALILFLIILFVSNLGAYPMTHSYFPYSTSETSLTYRLFFLGYILVALFLVLEALIFDKVGKKNRAVGIVFFIFLTTFVAVVTFEPGFPIFGHDYSYFFGPIWEIVHGKTIYTDVPSQYGFASTLFFALLYKLHVFHPFFLPAIIWLFYVTEYMFSFYIIYKVSRSLTLAVIGLISLITLNYFSIYHLPASIPQTGPMRFLPLILALFLLYKFKSIYSKKFIVLISLLSFWVLDSGISLVFAYLSTLFLLFILQHISFKNAAKACAYLGTFLVVIFALINFIHLLLGYKWINIFLVFAKLSEYAKAGFGMLPIDSLTYFWIVILIYFASVIYIFKNYHERESEDARFMRLGRTTQSGEGSFGAKKRGIELSLLLFSANLSLFASVYFVGRSHPHNLFHISIFPIINAFLLFSLFLHKIQNARIKLLVLSVLFILFIVYPIHNRQEIMTKTFITKFKYLEKGYGFSPAWAQMLEAKYKQDIALISKEMPDKKIVILSPDDTYLFYLTGKENLMDDNSQFTILTQKDISTSLKNVYEACPAKIVVDCTIYKKCQDSKPFTQIAGFSIQPVLLQDIQTKCNVSYKPDKCTNNLCIATKKL